MKLLAKEWASYRERVVPVNAHAIQVQESRRAFYAGAASLWGLLMTVLDPGEEPTDLDMAKMGAFQAELDDFQRDVEAGRA
ncbi:MAG TPA: hypothetical protein VJ735_09310 [Actinomycetes bacterium]|nr:hypothetical protein [Actinomycetes bacterium]